MPRFGSDPHEFFEGVYREAAPWDIGAPQPAMAALLDDYPPEGPALDVGCGSGDLALHLAARGLETLGIDFVEEAITQANAKRRAASTQLRDRLTFRVANALAPTALGISVGTVVDSGFYHLFEPAECRDYVSELASTLRRGGRLYLHEFAIGFPGPNLPREVTEEELREQFAAPHWRVVDIRSGEFSSRVAPVPGILACIERSGPIENSASTLATPPETL